LNVLNEDWNNWIVILDFIFLFGLCFLLWVP
jgi:hypothetical protein